MLASISGAAGMMVTALNFHQIDLLGEAGLVGDGGGGTVHPAGDRLDLAGLTIGYVGTGSGPASSRRSGWRCCWQHTCSPPSPPPAGEIVIVYTISARCHRGATRTASATLQPHWFGTGHIGSIQGALTLFGVGASALGPVVLTLTEEWMGSYPPAIVLLGLVPAAAGFVRARAEHQVHPTRRSA